MKIRRLLAWLLVFAMCFALTACHSDDKDSEKKEDEKKQEIADVQSGSASPLLYRVTDENGNIVWLFGSIHIGREDYYPLPSYVTDAFESSDTLAVEADIIAFEKDQSAQMQAVSNLIYTDGTSIKDHISQELYDKAVEILEENGLYMSMMDYYCPAMWSSVIESCMMEECGGNAELGIDVYLIEKAYESDKEIAEIESIDFQYKMMSEFSEDIQAELLESSVEMYEDKEAAADDLDRLMDLWASGDEAAFAAYLEDTDDEMTDEEKQLYEEYNRIMITDRNQKMADYAENALASGKTVFICVGSAHIIGEGAVADLLSERGYTVECIVN